MMLIIKKRCYEKLNVHKEEVTLKSLLVLLKFKVGPFFFNISGDYIYFRQFTFGC